MAKVQPAKLLLFGEYSIINNSLALAVPYKQIYGFWAEIAVATNPKNAIQSNKYLTEIAAYLSELKSKNELKSDINLQKFQSDIKNGLCFESNIPIGYGMGSSGALCAAIYKSYCEEKSSDNLQLQAQLAQLEGYFHGTSSGIDPLVSYLEQAILIQEDKTIKILPDLDPEHFRGNATMFLLDTEISRQTTLLVAQYLENGKEENFQTNYIAPIKKLVKEAIESLLGNRENLLPIIKEISALQYIYMRAMIPDAFAPIWVEGLNNGNYTLKLCGAGGGGFILGFTSNWEKTKLDLHHHKLRLLYQI